MGVLEKIAEIESEVRICFVLERELSYTHARTRFLILMLCSFVVDGQNSAKQGHCSSFGTAEGASSQAASRAAHAKEWWRRRW